MTVKRKTITAIVAADVLASLGIFGVQAWQIHELNNQQAQLNKQNTGIILNAAKNDCWSAVLDKALSQPAITPTLKAELLKDARKCVKLPTYPVTVSGQVVPPVLP
jgi:predicted negative regulator of RcsB-dependent stress response